MKGMKTGGRRPGSRNKKAVDRDEAMARAYEAAMAGVTPERLDNLTPLEAMLMCMRWAIEAKDRVGILACAAAAAPYTHARLSSSDVRVSGGLTNQSSADITADIAILLQSNPQLLELLPSVLDGTAAPLELEAMPQKILSHPTNQQ